MGGGAVGVGGGAVGPGGPAAPGRSSGPAEPAFKGRITRQDSEMPQDHEIEKMNEIIMKEGVHETLLNDTHESNPEFDENLITNSPRLRFINLVMNTFNHFLIDT